MAACDDGAAGLVRPLQGGVATSGAQALTATTTKLQTRSLSTIGASITTMAREQGQGRSGISFAVALKVAKTSIKATSCPTQGSTSRMAVVTHGTTVTTPGRIPVNRAVHGARTGKQSQTTKNIKVFREPRLNVGLECQSLTGR